VLFLTLSRGAAAEAIKKDLLLKLQREAVAKAVTEELLTKLSPMLSQKGC
jgi:hypothetical protein